MVRLSVAETVAGVAAESVTVTMTLNVPLSLVVPEMVALGVPEVKVSPAGRPVMVHLYGVVPPAAVTMSVRAVPAVPLVRGDVVVMVSVGGGATLIVKVRLATRWCESVTPICTLAMVDELSACMADEVRSAAAACAIPEIVRVDVVSVAALDVRPAGKPLTVQVNGAEPPETMMSQE